MCDGFKTMYFLLELGQSGRYTKGNNPSGSINVQDTLEVQWGRGGTQPVLHCVVTVTQFPSLKKKKKKMKKILKLKQVFFPPPCTKLEVLGNRIKDPKWAD